MRAIMIVRRVAGAAAIAALVAAVAGCPKNETANNGAPSGGGGGTVGKAMTIAVIPKGTKAQFWQSVHAGAEQAGKEENVKIDFDGPPSESDITGQINIVESKITAGDSGIVLAACDAHSLTKYAKQAMAKHIPVVTIDSGLDDPTASVAYIATDNVAGGRAAADALAQAIGKKGNVGLLIFHKGAASSDDREKGFNEGIAKYPDIHLVATLEANDPQKSTEAAINMLTAHPDLAGLFAANEPNGVAAANAVKQRNLVGKVKIVAYDSSDEEIKALKDGIIQATVVQDPFQMGYKGVKTCLEAIRGRNIPQKFIDSGMTVVTAKNMDLPEVQKLINPQGTK